MAHVDLTNDMMLGLPAIDAQHKQLVALSNSFIQALTHGMGADVQEEVFLKLKAYTCYHFEEEESYMRSVGYPRLEGHKTIHERLVREVDAFRDRFKKGVPPSPIETLDFINGWIVSHILKEDKAIGAFIQENE